MKRKTALSIRASESPRRPKDYGHDELTDPNPHGSPMHTAQLIGSLVIRFVWHAQSSNPTWNCFPDRELMEHILSNCRDRELAERHLTALLYHHSKILDNCGAPNNLRRLTMEAFPKSFNKMIESPKWEMLPEP